MARCWIVEKMRIKSERLRLYELCNCKTYVIGKSSFARLFRAGIRGLLAFAFAHCSTASIICRRLIKFFSAR